MGWRALGHVRARGQYAGRQLGGNTLDTGIDASLNGLLNCRVHAALLFLLLLLLVHFLDHIFGRNHVAAHTDRRGDRPDDAGAALEPDDLHIDRVLRSLSELDLALALCLALDSDIDTLHADLFLAGEQATRIRKHDQVAQLHEGEFKHVAVDIGADRLQNLGGVTHEHRQAGSCATGAAARLTTHILRDCGHVIRNRHELLEHLDQLLRVRLRLKETNRWLIAVPHRIIAHMPALPRVHVLAIFLGR